jgi:ABC-2 type transport system permease protein
MFWLLSRLIRAISRRNASAQGRGSQPGGQPFKAFRKLLRANLLVVTRDRTTLFFSFAFPIIFILIFGAIFSGDQTPTYDVGVVEQAHSRAGDAAVSAFSQAQVFKVHQGAFADELSKLKKGDRKAVVVIGAPGADGSAPVQVYSDPSQTSTAQVLLPLIQQVVGKINAALQPSAPALVLQQQSIGVKNLRSIDYLVPGILAMALMQLGLFSAIPLVTQRETKVLRRLSVTPLTRRTMVSAQVVQRLIVAAVQAVLLLGGGVLFFQVKITGNMPALAGFIVLGALVFVAMGFAVAGRARTAESAQPLIGVIQFPMLFLAGIFFPIELVPSALRPVVDALPLTYLGDALRQVSVNASPYYPLWLDTAVLFGWLAVCMAVAFRTFRWE